MTNQQESMYIKACVVANGVKDKQDDVITKTDIKKIFTNSIDVGFDIGHDNIRQSGIYSLENYISKQEESVGDHIVPSGSWMTILRVDNKDIQDKINKGEINGVSITAYPESDAEINRSNTKMLLYKDIVEKSQLHPKEISLVESPANNLPLEVMDYETYISKSEIGSKKMIEKEEQEINTKDSTISKLVDILSQYTHITKEEEIKEEDVKGEEEVEETPVETNLEEVVKEETPHEENKETETIQKTEDKPSDTGEPVLKKEDIQGAEDALLEIARLCTTYLTPETVGEVSKSSEEPTSIDNGSDEKTETLRKSEKQISEKTTQKYDDVQAVEHTDITRLFAEQQGRDPWTFEKLEE